MNEHNQQNLFTKGKPFEVHISSLFGGEIREISKECAYFSIYSSLDSPFMAVSALIADDDAIFSDLRVDGDKGLLVKARAGNGSSIGGNFHINTYGNTPQNNRKSQAVLVGCISPEHIHNASQKVQEYQFWYNPKPISDLIRFVFYKYLKVPLFSTASAPATNPAVNINIPKMHPMEAVSFLNERAQGSGKNLYAIYQKFNARGTPRYFYDDVASLSSQAAKWTFALTESNGGAENDDIIDKAYKAGQPISKILHYQSESHFNAHDTIKQGYPSRTYIKMDFINKTVESFDDYDQHTLIGKKQMPLVVALANSNEDIYGNRAIYEPFNGDSSYYTDPILEKSFHKSKPVASAFLGKRVTITTYGCPEVNPGDKVFLAVPEFVSEPERDPDKQYAKEYLVYSAQHHVIRSGEFTSKYELISDGQMQ